MLQRSRLWQRQTIRLRLRQMDAIVRIRDFDWLTTKGTAPTTTTVTMTAASIATTKDTTTTTMTNLSIAPSSCPVFAYSYSKIYLRHHKFISDFYVFCCQVRQNKIISDFFHRLFHCSPFRLSFFRYFIRLSHAAFN